MHICFRCLRHSFTVNHEAEVASGFPEGNARAEHQGVATVDPVKQLTRAKPQQLCLCHELTSATHAVNLSTPVVYPRCVCQGRLHSRQRTCGDVDHGEQRPCSTHIEDRAEHGHLRQPQQYALHQRQTTTVRDLLRATHVAVRIVYPTKQCAQSEISVYFACN